MNSDENLPLPDEREWWPATVRFPGDAGVTPKAAAALAAALTGRRFHFLRKEGKLRLRTDRPAADLLDQLVTDGLAAGWVDGIYEPETDAFGGPLGMDLAHEVWCADSPAALAETGSPHARERCILLISTMNRAAGLDPFEIGDVWAKVGNLRPAINPPEMSPGPGLSPPCGAS
ncbi:thiopeptide-type bacteriocin biosynthesis protein [Nonomuraea antimicrobica]